MKRCGFLLGLLAALAALGLTPGPVISAPRPMDPLADLFRDLAPDVVPTGILYDRVVSLSRPEDHDGSPGSPPVTLSHWRQIYFEMWHASVREAAWPPPAVIRERATEHRPAETVPIAIMNFRYNKIRPEALETGGIVVRQGRVIVNDAAAMLERRVLAATALTDRTFRGSRLVFTFDRDGYFSNDGTAVRSLLIDADDGRGFRPMGGGELHVAYGSPGSRTVRLKLTLSDGAEHHAGFVFAVESLEVPAPDDTLHIMASIPYLGEYGTGEAYVYLSDDHVTLTNPIVVIEGFDLDNSMDWDELYTLLNREGLLDEARSLGFDAVVLNFTEATTYLQRNAFVVAELLQQVSAAIEPERSLALIGASMGGLASRFALAYMETEDIPHDVRTFISFDSPQNGANIPLGIQYWLAFFADLSEDAAAWLAALDSPAARQMLAYHHGDPSDTTAASDPLRAELDADLAAMGDYPGMPRVVSIINGSSTQMDQGFTAGDQIIEWEYDGLFVDVIGNVWSVPDGGSAVILHGRIAILGLPTEEQLVTVSSTRPFDNAPGGSRNSMAEIDSSEAPFGDIVALHERHCFIPAVSALDLDTDDLFYDVAGDPDILAHTPFDVVYFPQENQEHSAITPENKAWFLAEVQIGVNAVGGASAERPLVWGNFPNPFSAATTIRFDLPESRRLRLGVYDAGGRQVTLLAEGRFDPGTSRVVWNGRDDGGRPVASGVYFVRLWGAGFAASRKVILR